MAITLLNVAEIIKKPSGLVFIYDSDGKLLQTIKDTKEIRRVYTGSPIPNTIGWSIQFTFDDNESNNVEFAVNNLTLVQYAAGKFQTYPDLGNSYALTEYYSKFESVYAYLANYVFLDCCETDPDNPIFAYPTNTWANWLIALNAGLLPKGLWIEVTAIPSQPSAIFSMFCTETNEIALGGFGQFLNADWQNVGVYTGVFALTGVAFTANIGQWYAGIEGTAIDGDVVIWNCLHYQVTDAAAFAGTDPAATPLAYTLLPKATANMGYITEVDQIEFVFVDDWLQYRADKQGNTYRFTETMATAFSIIITGIDYFQWGRDSSYANNSDNGFINVLNSVAVIFRNQLSPASQIVSNEQTIVASNTMMTSGQISGNTGDGAIDGNTVGSDSIINNNVFGSGSTISLNTLLSKGKIENKTLDPVIQVIHNIIGTEYTFTETLSTDVDHTTTVSGQSNDFRELDITGLTTIDIGTNAELVGIYNLTSSNATETINLISNFPTLFPFTLKPETGLTVTVTFTAVGSLSANDQIVGQSVFVVLNGDNGDELTLQAATFGAYSVTEQVELNQNN